MLEATSEGSRWRRVPWAALATRALKTVLDPHAPCVAVAQVGVEAVQDVATTEKRELESAKWPVMPTILLLHIVPICRCHVPRISHIPKEIS